MGYLDIQVQHIQLLELNQTNSFFLHGMTPPPTTNTEQSANKLQKANDLVSCSTPFLSTTHPTSTPLLPAVLLHHEDLDHANKDVQKVELQRDGLVDGVLLDDASLGETSMVENLLDIVEGEATEDGKTTIEPEALSEGESADGSGGKDERGETRDGDDGSTSEERSTDVEVLLLLGGGTDERDGTHHGESVETGASEESGRSHGEERSDESSLGGVEDSPAGILGNVAVVEKRVSECQQHRKRQNGEENVLVRVNGASSKHGTERESETTDADNPGVGGHETIGEARLEHLVSRQTDDADAESSVHEGLVEVRAFESGHAAVGASLPVEHELQSNPGAADHGAADEELAHQQAIVLLGLGVRLVLVTAAGALETSEEVVGGGLLGRLGGEEVGGLGRRLVECADGGGRTGRGLCELGNPRSQARRPSADGEGK